MLTFSYFPILLSFRLQTPSTAICQTNRNSLLQEATTTERMNSLLSELYSKATVFAKLWFLKPNLALTLYDTALKLFARIFISCCGLNQFISCHCKMSITALCCWHCWFLTSDPCFGWTGDTSVTKQGPCWYGCYWFWLKLSASLSAAHDVTLTTAQTEPLLTPGFAQHDWPAFPDRLKSLEMEVKPSLSWAASVVGFVTA